MSGGLMQLVAYGSQDVYLTGDPEITFWKGVYRRHTHFAIESIENTFHGNANFGEIASVIVDRNADLLSSMHLQIELPKSHTAPAIDGTATLDEYTWLWVKNIGNRLIKSTTVQIGGQTIDKQYGIWMDIWDELTTPTEKSSGYNAMVGKETPDKTQSSVSRMLYIPLQFWFCRHEGSAIPLVALQFHEVKLIVEFESLDNCQILVKTAESGNSQNTSILMGTENTNSNAYDKEDISISARLFCDYVYLDEIERQRFSQSSQQYMIEQLQHTKITSLSTGINTHSLYFNHPVKELIWVIRDMTVTDSFAYANVLSESGSRTRLMFNGHDRISARPGSYYRHVQPYQHHTRIPSSEIYVYSFAVSPEEHQPSGTANFSRLDNAEIILDVTSAGNGFQADIFAVNYNVLRIQSGIAGLAYSS